MAVLLDTGILLRLVDATDPLHEIVERAVDALIVRQEDLLIASQNIAEFWNVATRPAANNGLGLAPSDVLALYAETIAPICGVAVETEATPAEFVSLLAQYNVVGKQVHDARLVAIMRAWQIGSILTLNERNFRRFEPEGIVVLTPSSLTGSP
jgi:predicted nucleic acid-binding protein